MPFLSHMGRILNGLPQSGRIEGSLLRTLAQKSRNVDESKGLPSSMVPVKVESFDTLMFSLPLLDVSLRLLGEEITVQTVLSYGTRETWDQNEPNSR
jgi:hypothetical protein